MKIIRGIDYSEDLKTLKIFTEEFENNYFEKLELRVYKDSLPMDYIKRGAKKIYSTLNIFPKNFASTKYLRRIGSTLIYLSSDINPNGITGVNDVARTFTINYEVMCQSRRKWGREWYDDTLIKFYGYGRTPEEILNKFNSFVESDEFQKLYFK
jgi:hypothetical protein